MCVAHIHSNAHVCCVRARAGGPSAWSADECRRLLASVNVQLAVLHMAKMIHCDVKPDNIRCEANHETRMPSGAPGQPGPMLPGQVLYMLQDLGSLLHTEALESVERVASTPVYSAAETYFTGSQDIYKRVLSGPPLLTTALDISAVSSCLRSWRHRFHLHII